MKRRSNLPPSLHGREITINSNKITLFEIKPGTYLWRNHVPEDMKQGRVYRMKYFTGVFGKNLYPHQQIEEMTE